MTFTSTAAAGTLGTLNGTAGTININNQNAYKVWGVGATDQTVVIADDIDTGANDVTVLGNLTIAGTKTLTIASGRKIALTAGKTLTMTGDITGANATASVVVKDKAQFETAVQKVTVATVDVDGTIELTEGSTVTTTAPINIGNAKSLKLKSGSTFNLNNDLTIGAAGGFDGNGSTINSKENTVIKATSGAALAGAVFVIPAGANNKSAAATAVTFSDGTNSLLVDKGTHTTDAWDAAAAIADGTSTGAKVTLSKDSTTNATFAKVE